MLLSGFSILQLVRSSLSKKSKGERQNIKRLKKFLFLCLMIFLLFPLPGLSRQARSLAEDAFLHPSIMSISYYSFEHCFAVYSVCNSTLWILSVEKLQLRIRKNPQRFIASNKIQHVQKPNKSERQDLQQKQKQGLKP